MKSPGTIDFSGAFVCYVFLIQLSTGVIHSSLVPHYERQHRQQNSDNGVGDGSQFFPFAVYCQHQEVEREEQEDNRDDDFYY